MSVSATTGQFAEELGELHDGSVSLFVTLPVFRSLLVSERSAAVLTRFEAAIAEHLAHLDGIVGQVLVRHDRADGDLTRSLFRDLTSIGQRAPSVQRDTEILGVLEHAQLFLMGSCGYALRFARQAGVDRAAHVLEESLRRIGALALHFPGARSPRYDEFEAADAVA